LDKVIARVKFVQVAVLTIYAVQRDYAKMGVFEENGGITAILIAKQVV
jgi:hypothetical protein